MLAEQDQLAAIAQHMQARFIHNLETFRQHLPQLHKVLAALPPNEATVDISYSGVRLIFDNADIYPHDPWEMSKDQIDKFVDNASSFSLYPVPPKHDGIKQHEAMTKLIPSEELSPAQILSYEFDRQNVPLMLCFGVGCGFHIEQLIARLNLRHLVLFEQSPAVLRASLYCVDWWEIFDVFSKPGRHLDIVLGCDVEVSADAALQSIRRYSPIFSTTTFLFDHFEGPFYEALKTQVKAVLSVAPQGMGFYDDELTGITQTRKNLQSKPSILRHPPATQNDCPAFIVGSGPSLNSAIDTIRKHQDSAIIFSCGSSIGPLLANGIVPDFHLEQERHEHTKLMLEALEQKDQLSEIDLIMLNVVPGEISRWFKSTSIALKGHDSAAHMFPPGTPQLNYSNPTVTNFGVALSTFLNFKQIYLFGVDLSITDLESHHADATAYENRDIKEWLTTLEDSLNRVLPGNFRETVRSHDMFNWARVHFECISSSELHNRQFFNCSDGARIKGFEPLRPNQVDINRAEIDKRKSRLKVKHCFSSKTKSLEYFEQALDHINNDFTRTVNDLIAILSSPIENRSDFVDLADKGYLRVSDSSMQRSTHVIAQAIYKHFMLLTNAYSSSIKNPADAMDYTRKSIEHFVDFLAWSKQDFDQFVQNLRRGYSVEY
ncbi:MAG: 6-hydroxymethylpterin diphosphokinase MptE-like protein [Pseudomonadota bacterium]